MQQVAVDGKSLQGARTTGVPSVPMHLMHTFLVEGREVSPGGAGARARRRLG